MSQSADPELMQLCALVQQIENGAAENRRRIERLESAIVELRRQIDRLKGVHGA